MIDFKIKVDFDKRPVEQGVEKAKYRNFPHAAASIRKDATASIQPGEDPSAPGTPPHTGRRRFLRRSIRFAANKEGAVIGTLASIVGVAGAAHEHGGEFRGTDYPARPFMLPALQRNLMRFAGDWQDSIK